MVPNLEQRKEFLQYAAETALIEELAADYCGLQKQAGMVDDLLGGVTGSVKDLVSNVTDSDRPGGIAGNIIGLLVPSILFRLNPVLGIVYFAASMLGFDIQGVISKIVNAIKPKLLAGEPVSAQEVNQVGKAAVSAEAGPIDSNDVREANYSIVSIIKEADFWEELDKARPKKNVDKLKTPWFFGEGKSKIERIFGNLFAKRATGKVKWLIGGIIIWLIKTVLASAGLLIAAGAVSKVINKNLPSANLPGPPLAQDKETKERVKEEERASQAPTSKLKPSGRGQQTFANNANNHWIVPLVNRSIEDTLITWAIDVYPELKGLEAEMEASPDFQRVLGKLKMNYKSSSPDKLPMHKDFQSRKEVVDQFAHQIKG